MGGTSQLVYNSIQLVIWGRINCMPAMVGIGQRGKKFTPMLHKKDDKRLNKR
jgi:hypothetical protein